MQNTALAWHRLAAAGFVIRLPLTLVLLVGTTLSPAVVGFAVVLHLVLAAGCWVRHPLALGFGLYAAFLGLALPFLLSNIAWPQPWSMLNAAFSVVLLAVTFMAWRTRDAVTA